MPKRNYVLYAFAISILAAIGAYTWSTRSHAPSSSPINPDVAAAPAAFILCTEQMTDSGPDRRDCGLVDIQGAPRVHRLFASLDGGFNEGLLLFKQDDKWGYTDGTGVDVIAPTYLQAQPFAEGLAAVCGDSTNEPKDSNGVGISACGYIDHAGHMTVRIDPALAASRNFSMSDFHEHRARIRIEHSQLGEGPAYIDNSGVPIALGLPVEPVGSRVFISHEYSEGLAAISRGSEATLTAISEMHLWEGKQDALGYQDGYGFVDPDGKLVIPFLYTPYSSFHHGRALVMALKSHQLGWVDRQGRFTPLTGLPTGKGVEYGISPYHEGYAVMFVGINQNDGMGGHPWKWNLVDEEGHFLGDWHDGAPTLVPSDYTTDTTIPYDNVFFDKMAYVSEGVMPVTEAVPDQSAAAESQKENASFHFVDIHGRDAFTGVFNEAHYFSDGLAAVRTGKKWGFVDHQGRWAVAANFDDVISDFKQGAAVVRVGTVETLIDHQGRVITDYAKAFSGFLPKQAVSEDGQATASSDSTGQDDPAIVAFIDVCLVDDNPYLSPQKRRAHAGAEARICAQASLRAMAKATYKAQFAAMAAATDSPEPLMDKQKVFWHELDSCKDDACIAGRLRAEAAAPFGIAAKQIAKDTPPVHDPDVNPATSQPPGEAVEKQLLDQIKLTNEYDADSDASDTSPNGNDETSAGDRPPAEQLSFERFDLNGDGKDEILVTQSTSSSNQPFWLFTPQADGRYRMILSGGAGYLAGFEPGTAKHNGFPDIRNQIHDSCCEHEVNFYRYDGHVYVNTLSCTQLYDADETPLLFCGKAETSAGNEKSPQDDADQKKGTAKSGTVEPNAAKLPDKQVVVGPRDQNADDRLEFTHAIDAQLRTQCIDVRFGEDIGPAANSDFPRELEILQAGETRTEDQAKTANQKNAVEYGALVKAGLLSTEETQNSSASAGSTVPVKTYALTDEGKKALMDSQQAGLRGIGQSSFCAGRFQVDEITYATQPALNSMGLTVSSVSYTFSPADVPAWARDEGFKAAFPDFAKELMPKQRAQVVVIREPNGWTASRNDVLSATLH